MSRAVRLGPLTVNADEVDGSRVPVFLDQSRAARDEGRLVLVSRRPPGVSGAGRDGEGSLADLESLVESIGDCAAVPLAAGVPGRSRDAPEWPLIRSALLGLPAFPCLVGRPDDVRAVIERAGLSQPDALMCRSHPVRTDFRSLVQRWCADDESTEQVLHRLRSHTDAEGVAAYLLGELLAHCHRKHVLHGDTRRSSFGFTADSGAVIIKQKARMLCSPPTPGQCASDLAPLLESFSGGAWRAFRLGYAHDWPDASQVLDYVELGDTTGWVGAMGRRRYADAADRLDRALGARTPDDPPGHLTLLVNRAYSYSRLGRHDQACTDADTMLPAAATLIPELLPVVQLHAGFAYLRGGRYEAAARMLVTLIAGPRTPTVKNLAVRALRTAYTGPGAMVPDDDLAFLVRRGHQVTVLQPFDTLRETEADD
ncbi:hypothetical protein QLQ12_01210 [Actinoplanes sp. NEAU-A12]|uniref:Tetratricopeptide repeat protein n=1 Tax=Actinoplanes sandaracinus TaxID=3045177 RepID=A0ABT6WBV8_9ACTN|nr:hypothetical protein [Actinoplanes sandaracinus]MDI6097227.1 hypothetical protein [Actinoplanes sandaracinus]